MLVESCIQINRIVKCFIEQNNFDQFVQMLSKIESDSAGSRSSSSNNKKSNRQLHERIVSMGSEFGDAFNQCYNSSNIIDKMGNLLSEFVLVVQDCSQYCNFLSKLTSSAKKHDRIASSALIDLLQVPSLMSHVSVLVLDKEVIMERGLLNYNYRCFEDKQKSRIFDLLTQRPVNSIDVDGLLLSPLDELFYLFGSCLSRVSSLGNYQGSNYTFI